MKQARWLSDLISDMIFLSKIGESNQEKMLLPSVDVSKAVDEVAESLRTVLDNEGKQLLKQISLGVKLN